MDEARRFDVVIVGAGIIGLASAYALLTAKPGIRLAVVEKEEGVGEHQSGRNSGVLHSGIYYRPGSRKAELTASGRVAMLRFCEAHGVPHEICGKLIVATDDKDLARLSQLEARASENGVAATRLGPDAMRDLEPHVAGIAALHVRDAGIVDYHEVTKVLAAEVQRTGGHLQLGCCVLDITEGPSSVVLNTTIDDLHTDLVVNCGGLQADQLAQHVIGRKPDLRIIPFRGEYFELVEARRFLVRNLIYPVADPELPFLGVHLSRSTTGSVHAGPNAVLALAREGYSWSSVDMRELRSLMSYPGLRRLARAHWRTGISEVRRSLRRRVFVKALRRLVPELEARDLVAAPAGVRAQAVDRDGHLLDDFEIRESSRSVHVLNAPSPAATASLEIGRSIAGRVLQRLA